MPGNTQQLADVFQTLSAVPRADGGGQGFAVASHKSGAGTSYVARQLALAASAHKTSSKRVLLLDADIQNNAQSQALFAPEATAIYGTPHGPYDATFGQIPFWMVTPATIGTDGLCASDAHFVSLHILLQNDLAFTHFHWEQLREGQTVMIRNARNYWHELRQQFAFTIIDVPALDRADITNEICKEADTTVLVAGSGDTHSAELSTAFAKLGGQNCHCAGMIINDVPVHMSGYGGIA